MENNVGTKRKRDPQEEEYHKRRKSMAYHQELKANEEKSRNVRDWTSSFLDRTTIQRFGESEQKKVKTVNKIRREQDALVPDRDLYKKLDKKLKMNEASNRHHYKKLQSAQSDNERFIWQSEIDKSREKSQKINDQMDEALYNVKARAEIRTKHQTARKQKKKEKDGDFHSSKDGTMKDRKNAIKADFREHFPENNRHDARDFVNIRLHENPNPQTIAGVNRQQENLQRQRKGQPKIKKNV